MKPILNLVMLVIIAGCAELTREDPAAAPQVADAKPAPAMIAADQQQPQKPTHFRKREAKLVDKSQALAENPDLVEVENRINATNYVSALSQMYFAAGSNLQLMQLKHQVDLMYNMDERYPTFEEFSALLKQFNIRLGNLYDWQMYAYDDQTGEIGILEDSAMKQRMREGTGRE